VYNAFLMPFNAKDNIFDYTELFENCGEAVGDWKNKNNKYEHVQGILVDINYLMHNYTGNHSKKVQKLAELIEKSFDENGEISFDNKD
jgi:HD-GYP domain-containing protein (c-di-GMP phosphodiesterase class II)